MAGALALTALSFIPSLLSAGPLPCSFAVARISTQPTVNVSTVPATPPGPLVDVSTVTGVSMEFDDTTGTAIIEGSATVKTATATMTADKITLNNNAKTGYAVGNVKVIGASGTITGSEATYNWESSTGVITNATGETPPWRFSADQMDQEGQGLFDLHDGNLTSCDLNPPHYHVRAAHGKVRTGVRANMKNARLMVDETPAFYFPFYTRSLRPKKYTLRLEPGSSGRDGFTNRTIIGYPFTANTYTKFRWDFLERTGNGAGLEHRYFNPNIRGDIDGYYIRDINPDEQPQSRRYSVLWNHYQRLTSRLTANAKLDVKSDQVFGNEFSNVGNDVRVENQSRGVFSEGGLNYQFPRASLQVQADRRDKFDSKVSSSNFISKLTLPRVTYDTIPIKYFGLPFYTSFSSDYTNETLTRADPDETLRYQRSGGAGLTVKRDIRLSKTLTWTPLTSYREAWQDRDLALKDSSKDLYIGRYTVGSSLRKRFGRSVDTTLSYLYGERFAKNRTTLDSLADDRGIELNLVTGQMVSRIGRNTRLSLVTGYNYLGAPRSAPERFRHQAARLTPPSLDLQYQASRTTSLFFRETYALFDPANNKIVKTPLNTSGEVQIGNTAGVRFFSQGFSYTKNTALEAPSELLLTNKLRFYPSKFWHIDFFLSYRALAPQDVDYRKLAPIEKTIRIARDLHCWIIRMEFSERPGRKEASFYIDLKANVAQQRNVFTQEPVGPESKLDVSQIFPADQAEVPYPDPLDGTFPPTVETLSPTEKPVPAGK